MDPKEIFRSDKVLEFWPSDTQTARERVAATTRFVLYTTCIVYLISKDVRIFALGAMVLAILYYMWVSNMIIDGKVRPTYGDARGVGMFRGEVTMPTMDNSMANVLMTDYVDRPDRPSAAWYPSVRQEVANEWDFIHPLERKRDAERNFYTMPATTIPNDQAAFAQAAYGKPFAPMCKDQGGAACDIDNPRFHFPEEPQMRGGRGRGN
jgi:hypothetical protein